MLKHRRNRKGSGHPGSQTMVVPVDCTMENERMAAQQRLFLCSLGVYKHRHVPFDMALLTMIFKNNPQQGGILLGFSKKLGWFLRNQRN
jgi:hypothetical protein